MSNNSFSAIIFVLIVVLLVLFQGSPDIHDHLIPIFKNLASRGCA